MVERGLLPTHNYIEMGGEGSVLILRVEPTQILCVPWVVDVLPCLGSRSRYAPPGIASWTRYGPSHGGLSFDVLVCLRRRTRLPSSKDRPRTRLLW
jgi:hypothetical protein